MTVEPRTLQGRTGLEALVADPGHALVAFDYDGTLSAIVEDPSKAVPHPDVPDALAALSSRVGLLAIITGRPARLAVELGALDRVAGLERLVVMGHYGMERWDASTGEFRGAEPPARLELVRERLPDALAAVDLSDADVEDKGLSVAVHVRRLADPAAAFARMSSPLRELAAEADLVAEPGRFVVELRPEGMDKGQALRSLVDESGARVVAFTGDDLGDLAAFDEVDRLRAAGLAGLLVCSGSDEVSELADRADLVVDGPAGVVAFIADLTALLPPTPPASGQKPTRERP
jgi:trehalose 6-phosphate phosphatase